MCDVRSWFERNVSPQNLSVVVRSVYALWKFCTVLYVHNGKNVKQKNAHFFCFDEGKY